MSRRKWTYKVTKVLDREFWFLKRTRYHHFYKWELSFFVFPRRVLKSIREEEFLASDHEWYPTFESEPYLYEFHAPPEKKYFATKEYALCIINKLGD